MSQEETLTKSRQETIEHILAATETIAVVGFSSRESRAGFYVPAYLQEHGYRIIPVNPYLEEALGERAYPDLTAIPADEAVDLVLIFRQSHYIPPIVEEAITLEMGAVWMQLGIINHQAAEQARAAGLEVVMDACMLVEHRRWAAQR